MTAFLLSSFDANKHVLYLESMSTVSDGGGRKLSYVISDNAVIAHGRD